MLLGCRRFDLAPDAPSLRAHAALASRAPAALSRADVDFRPRMDANDTVGDCVPVAFANIARAQEAVRGAAIDIPTDKVLALYSAVTGYSPSVPNSDQGTAPPDLLAYQTRHGFDAGLEAPMVALWGSVDPGDFNGIRVVAEQCALAMICVDLSLSDQATIGQVWNMTPPAAAGDATPGSWDLHCLGLWAYDGTDDDSLVYLATWGMLQAATWGWVRSRLKAAFGVMFGQLSPGFDRDRLAADCHCFVSGGA